jgi:hypothetical protein
MLAQQTIEYGEVVDRKVGDRAYVALEQAEITRTES